MMVIPIYMFVNVNVTAILNPIFVLVLLLMQVIVEDRDPQGTHRRMTVVIFDMQKPYERPAATTVSCIACLWHFRNATRI